LNAYFGIAKASAACIALALAIALPGGTVAQTASITISPGTATGIGLASAAQYQVLSDAQWADYEKVVDIAVLNGITKMAANSGQTMKSADYTSIATTVQAKLDASAPSAALFQRMDIGGRLRYGIDSLTSLASGQPAGSLLPKTLFGLEKAKFFQLEIPVDPSRRQPADPALYAVTSSALQFIANQVQQASDLAQNDGQYAAAVNVLLSGLTAFDSSKSYATIQTFWGTALPSLPAPNSDGSYTLNEPDLMTQYQSVVAGVQTIIDSELTALEANPPTLGRSVVLKGNSRAVPYASPTANSCVISHALPPGFAGPVLPSVDPCQIAQSDVTGLSSLVGLFDPSAGTQIAAIGTAGVQAGLAIAQILSPAVTGAAVLGPVGIVVGAGVAIFSALESSSSSSNAAVLAQIQKLSQQIARLQQDMDAQFALVDAGLNTILTTLNQDFALINYQLGTLNASAQQIQDALLDVETQVNQIEYYDLAYQQAEEADTLMLSANGCLNFASTHNNQDIGYAQFDNCQNTFFTWGQTNALDAIWAPVPSDYTDSSVYNFFEDFSNSGVCPIGCATPDAVGINYLSNFSSQNLGVAPLSTLFLPNPDEWVLAARMYLLMAHQWPQYQSGLNVSYLNDLLQIGTNLQQAAQSINSSRATNGQVSQNTAIFNALTTKYTSAIGDVQSAANSDQTTYLSNPALTINGITPNWWGGGASQTTSWRPPPPASIRFCDGGGETLTPAPSSLFSFVPGIYAFAQGYLSAGTLTMCISNVQWVNTVDPFTNPPYEPNDILWCDNAAFDIPPGQPDVAYPPDNCQISEPQITISVRFNGTEILTATATAGDATQQDYIVSWWSDPTYCGCTDSSFSVDPSYAVQFLWTPSSNSSPFHIGDILANLNNSPTVTQQPAPGLLSTTVAQIDAALATVQQQMYGKIANDFSAAGTPIQIAGQLLSSDKLLFQAYANLGLPISMQSDDTLHSYLFGDEPILDWPGVQSDFAGFSTSAITNTTDDKVTDEIGTLNSRLSGLTTEISADLANVGTNQLPESLSEVDLALEDLQSFANLQNANALTPCSFQLTPNLAFVGMSGSAGTIQVQELNGCAWTASTRASWLTIAPRASGVGNGFVNFSATSDTTDSGRDAVIIVGDQVFHVLQTAGGNTIIGGSGSGSAPVASLSTTNIGFGNQTVGTSSAPTNITLSNTGSSSLVTGITATTGYYEADNCGTVSPGGNCTISVVFSPPATGTDAGLLTISSNASGSPQTVVLTGVGMAAPVAAAGFTVTASTLTVTKGLTGSLGTVSLTFTPVNGFANVITLSNCVVPTSFLGGSCSAPGSVSLAGTSSATVSVTIATSASTAVLQPPPNPRWSTVGRGFELASVFVLLIPARRRKRLLIAPFLLFAFVACGLSGCGGGSVVTSTGASSQTIPAGTYSFTITATSGALSYPITIPVTVE
jgi:hypothetical protein